MPAHSTNRQLRHTARRIVCLWPYVWMFIGVVQCVQDAALWQRRCDLCPACAAHNMSTSPLAYWSISVEHQDADDAMYCCCNATCCCAVFKNCGHVGCGMTLAIFGSCKAHAHKNYHSTSSSSTTTTTAITITTTMVIHKHEQYINSAFAMNEMSQLVCCCCCTHIHTYIQI